MKILIVDDHPMVCNGLRSILLSEQGIDEIMTANETDTALDLIDKHNFDLVLADMRIKNKTGVYFIQQARLKQPNCKYAIVTSSSAMEDFDKALNANVDGYILKDALPEDIVYAVKAILRGKKYFDPVFYEKSNEKSSALASRNPEDQLSPREAEILNYIGKGLSNKSIAGKLFISENTVKKHVSKILDKLNLSDRTQAALYISKVLERDS